MIFNNKDLLSTVSGVSINKEIPPMMIGRSITTLNGSRKIYVGNAGIASQTYTIKLNLKGATMTAAWAIRQEVAAWAFSTAEAPLIPTHQPTIYYNAILQSISNPTFVFGACTVDVVFLIPTPYAYSTTTLTPTGTDSLTFNNLGSAEPVVRLTLVPSAAMSNPTVLVNGVGAFVAAVDVEANVPMVVDFENKTFMLNSIYANEYINFFLTDWTPGWVTGTNTISCTGAALSAEVVQKWL